MGLAIVRRGPGDVDGRLEGLKGRGTHTLGGRRSALAAVQERSVPRPRCATPLRGEDAYGGPAHAVAAARTSAPRQSLGSP